MCINIFIYHSSSTVDTFVFKILNFRISAWNLVCRFQSNAKLLLNYLKNSNETILKSSSKIKEKYVHHKVSGVFYSAL